MATQAHTDIEVDYDVAIVGLGPVGITLTGLLARHGLRVLAVDAAPDIYDLPRAMGMDHEVMRVFQQLGLAERLAPVTSAYRPSEYRTAEGEVIRRFDSQKPPYPLGWPPYMTFLQPELEGILRAHAAKCETVEMRVNTEVTGLSDIEDCPKLTLLNRVSGDVSAVRSRFVVGCDGGGSFVRRNLGIGFEDLVFDEPWVVIDMLLEREADLPEINVQFCDPARPHTFVVGPGNLRRWEFMLLPGEDPAEMAKEETVRALLEPWLRPDQARLWRAATYRFHALVAERWRSGNVFLAGDACHMTPPFLAQGMVQGIKDSVNLAWKIAAVLRGAPGALLDTYEQERRPLVREVISITKELGRIICECDFERANERNRRLRAEMAQGTGVSVRQDLFPPIRSGLVSPGPDAISDAAGRPAPQPVIRTKEGPVQLLDNVTGARFRLLALPGFQLDDAAAQLAEALEIDCHVIAAERDMAASDGILIEQDTIFGDWMSKYGCDAILVRPDHTVFTALRTSEELQVALGALASWLRKP